MFYDLMRKRRSIRRYEHLEIEKEKITLVLKSALLSPSSRSIRPWEFMLVDDREKLKKLAEAKPHDGSFLKTAAAAVVVFADPVKSDVWVEDAAIASLVILLMAEELKLGACWCQIRKRSHASGISASEYVKRLLGIPQPYEVESIIALGYPGEIKDAYDDTSLCVEKLHSNFFGASCDI